ncbi:MAG: hypothetical protein JO104_07920 [Candidatus Eremiobacteraeota bacterium]|nr:hypothetical protein [Candidatus Eremiobacteraeota bacterium]
MSDEKRPEDEKKLKDEQLDEVSGGAATPVEYPSRSPAIGHHRPPPPEE